jgi:hypothetical protein
MESVGINVCVIGKTFVVVAAAAANVRACTMQLARMDCLTSLICCQKGSRHPVPAASFTLSHCSTSLLRPSRMSVIHTYVNKSFKCCGGRR